MSQFLKKIMGGGSDDQKSQNKTSAEEKTTQEQSVIAEEPRVKPMAADAPSAAPASDMGQGGNMGAASFSAQRERPAPFPTGPQCTTIGPDVAITGKLSFADKAVINGKFSGQIKSAGSLFIGRDGQVKSDLSVGSCVVEGALVGNISASGNVELRSKSSLKGDIKAVKLKIEDGVVFRGHCCVGEDVVAEGVKKEDKAAAKD